MKANRRWFGYLGFTAVLLALVIGASEGDLTWLSLVVLLTLVSSAGFFLLVFPGSRFFAIALANYVTVYFCLFDFFVEVNFAGAPRWCHALGFALPLLGFTGGALIRQEAIASVIADDHLRQRERLPELLSWLVPVLLVGVMGFMVPDIARTPLQSGVALVAAQAAIAVFVFLASRTICVFLINTGLLFEDFFHRMSAVGVPIFAFVTFYSMIVIVFAAVYRILDRLSAVPPFLINGKPSHIEFLDALYFSLITLSTVGYGDIVPVGSLARLLVCVEIVAGVLLLLFGFAEIRRFSLEHPDRTRR